MGASVQNILRVVSRQRIILMAVVGAVCTSCFTGIESTRTISDKDVAKVVTNSDAPFISVADTISTGLLEFWQSGKKLYVSDNNLNMLLIPEGYNPDSLLLEGSILEYDGCIEDNINGVSNTVILKLRSADGLLLYYDTSKSRKELSDSFVNRKMPFLIDCDLINNVKAVLIDKSLYVTSALWIDSVGNYIQGNKFEQVTVKTVEPGNKVYSLKIGFGLPDGSVKYMYVALKEDSVPSRMFGNIFSFSDPHLLYPNISDSIWNLIKRGKVCDGMTKEECRLSLGNPVNIRRIPTYNGLHEYWFYDNGIALNFVDGCLEGDKK